jgi:pilus assembly protein CpaE
VGCAEVAAAARWHPSGLALLAAEPFDTASGRLDGAAVARLLGLVRDCFDVVIVDVPARLDDRGAAALATADAALLVTTPEVPCVVAARRLVDALAWRHFSLARMGVVVNMLVESEGVTPERIASAICMPLAGTIPFDPEAVRRTVNSAREHGGALRPGKVHTALAAISARVLPVTEPERAAGRGDPATADPGGGGRPTGGQNAVQRAVDSSAERQSATGHGAAGNDGGGGGLGTGDFATGGVGG